MTPCNILLGPTSHTLVIVLSVVITGVSVLILIVIIVVVVCVWKKYGTATYWPRRTEINQGVELEGNNIQNEESRSNSATAANPPPQTENET